MLLFTSWDEHYLWQIEGSALPTPPWRWVQQSSRWECRTSTANRSLGSRSLQGPVPPPNLEVASDIYNTFMLLSVCWCNTVHLGFFFNLCWNHFSSKGIYYFLMYFLRVISVLMLENPNPNPNPATGLRQASNQRTVTWLIRIDQQDATRWGQCVEKLTNCYVCKLIPQDKS